MSDIDHLIRMANQIAENFGFHDDQVARTADHIKRFWAPQMRRKLADHLAGGGEGVAGPVVEALKRIEA